MAAKTSFRGSFTALVTPFKNGSVDEKAFRELIDWQIAEGTKGLVPVGTTGESPTLSHEEHRHVVEWCIDQTRGRVPVVAGAGSNSTREATDLARHAEEAGADAVLVVTPYYNKPSQEGLFQHFQAAHDATGLPIILYDVPSRTGLSLQLDTICRLAALPRIVGLKDATGDLTRPVALRRMLGDGFRMLSGDDATALDYLGLGGDGCISVTSNVVPRLCNRLFLACFCGEPEEARSLERQLKPLVAALFLESNPVPLKWALSLVGQMSAELRLPLCLPAEATRGQVRKALAQLGLIGPSLMRNARRALSLTA